MLDPTAASCSLADVAFARRLERTDVRGNAAFVEVRTPGLAP